MLQPLFFVFKRKVGDFCVISKSADGILKMGDSCVIPKSADGILKMGDSCVIPKVCRRHPCNIKRNLFAQINLDRQISFYIAESGGFEPSIRLRVYRISSAALSTTQTTFLFYSLQRYCFFLNYASNTLFFYFISLQKCHLSRR